MDPHRLTPHQTGPILSLDLGGTKMLGLLIDSSAAVSLRQVVPSPKRNHPVMQAVIALLADLLGQAERMGTHPAGIAICAPGFIDPQSGILVDSDNLEVKDLALTGPVEAQFCLPTRLYHDVKSSTLAEALFGSGTGRGDFAYLNIGTGVSVGLYLGGKVYPGAAGRAGEIGHIALAPVGPGKPCGLGLRLEALASGPGLVHRAVVALAGEPHSQLARLVSEQGGEITPQLIQQASSSGDPLASRLIEETADYLGLAIGNLVDILDLECVVLGGGVAQMGALRQAVEASVSRYALQPVPVIASHLEGEAGAIGAAAFYYGLGG